MDDRLLPDHATLAALGLERGALAPLESGHINISWLATLPDGEQRVLQILNPIFPAATNRDIDAVTAHLAAKGLPTPRIVALADGALWLEAQDRIWRQLSYVPGETVERVRDGCQAREAGALLGRFHAALTDFEHDFVNARLGVHDLDLHVAALESALSTQQGHRNYPAIKDTGARIVDTVASLPALPHCSDRNVHGDPKISNIVFDAACVHAICFIDLDTLARMPVALELGDALRSWCNCAEEDSAEARFDVARFRAALQGYAAPAREFIAETEWRAIPAATLRIAVELAARFCADALNECYFGWDSRRYASASDHNQARACAQLELARSIRENLGLLETETQRVFRE